MHSMDNLIDLKENSNGNNNQLFETDGELNLSSTALESYNTDLEEISNNDTEETGKDQGIAENNLSESSAINEHLHGEMSKINRRISQYTEEELVKKLKLYKLDTDGSVPVLKKRLISNYRAIKCATVQHFLSKAVFPYYIVVDFEATCDEVNLPHFQYEIIEFPAVLVNSATLIIEDSFQMYCKPVVNPKLTPFCTELTGITQKQVDTASPFPEVYAKFEEWLMKHQLGSKHKFSIVTDGPWDMTRFLYCQCLISEIPFPKWGRTWLNIKKAFSYFYQRRRCCLKLMLEHLKMGFEGRPHCGLDDSKNIARLLMKMICDGAAMQTNEVIELEQKKLAVVEENKKLMAKNDKKPNIRIPGWNNNWSDWNSSIYEANYKSSTKERLKDITEIQKEKNKVEAYTAKQIQKLNEEIRKLTVTQEDIDVEQSIESAENINKVEQDVTYECKKKNRELVSPGKTHRSRNKKKRKKGKHH